MTSVEYMAVGDLNYVHDERDGLLFLPAAECELPLCEVGIDEVTD